AAEALGLMMARAFGFDGVSILLAVRSALEDANWHTEAAQVEKWIDDLDKPEGEPDISKPFNVLRLCKEDILSHFDVAELDDDAREYEKAVRKFILNISDGQMERLASKIGENDYIMEGFWDGIEDRIQAMLKEAGITENTRIFDDECGPN